MVSLVSVYPTNRTLVSKNVRIIEHYEKGRTLTTTHFCLEETIYFKPSFQPLLCSKFHWRRLILLLLHSFVFKVYKINQENVNNVTLGRTDGLKLQKPFYLFLLVSVASPIIKLSLLITQIPINIPANLGVRACPNPSRTKLKNLSLGSNTSLHLISLLDLLAMRFQ